MLHKYIFLFIFILRILFWFYFDIKESSMDILNSLEMNILDDLRSGDVKRLVVDEDFLLSDAIFNLVHLGFIEECFNEVELNVETFPDRRLFIITNKGKAHIDEYL